MTVPTTPNRPLSTRDEPEVFGTITLRYNETLDFLENASFDQNIVCYDDKYQNNQSLSLVFRRHMQEVHGLLKKQHPKGSKFVEVGCGKGDFVELALADEWFEIEGYDGAYDGANPRIHKRYLDDTDRIESDLVVLRHVLEHIQRPHKFLAQLARIFGSTDIYIEVPDYRWIAEEGSFFDITYEHVNYFNAKSLSCFFATVNQHGYLFDGQYQYIIANLGELDGGRFADGYESDGWQYETFDDLFPSFASKIEEIQRRMPGPGSNLYVWGAATKGVMFLHHLKRIDRDFFSRFRGAIDINEKKIGKYLPSTKLPIINPATYTDCAEPGDLIVISNPNYKDEIVAGLALAGLADISTMCL